MIITKNNDTSCPFCLNCDYVGTFHLKWSYYSGMAGSKGVWEYHCPSCGMYTYVDYDR